MCTKAYLLCFLLCLVSACKVRTSEKINAEAVNREIESRKIKRIKEGEILSMAYEKGGKLAGELLKKIDENKNNCNKKWTLLQTNAHLIEEARTLCEAPPKIDEKEKMLWKAYFHDFERGIPLKKSIQKAGKRFLYFHPLVQTDSAQNKKLLILRIVLKKREIVRLF